MSRTERKDNKKGKHPVLFSDSRRKVPMEEWLSQMSDIGITLTPVTQKGRVRLTAPWSRHPPRQQERAEGLLLAVSLRAWAFLIRKLLPTPF